MKRSLFFTMAILASLAVHGQKIFMYPTFGGAHFEYEIDTVVYQVSPRQVKQIMYDHPAALDEFKKARTGSSIAGVMGFLGAGLIIVPIATAVVGGDVEWALAAGGAGLIMGSIPISTSYKRHAQHAIETFNSKHTASILKPEFYFSGSGVRIVIRF